MEDYLGKEVPCPSNPLYLARTVIIIPYRWNKVRVLIDYLNPVELRYKRTYSARQYIESAFRSQCVRADHNTIYFFRARRLRDLSKPIVF